MPPTYLWQRPNWTSALRWDSGSLQPLLASLRRRQGHLLGRASSLGVDLGRELQADTVVLDAMRTSAVEGEQLDAQGVRSSVARRLGLSTAGRPAPRPVDGLVTMILDNTLGHALDAAETCLDADLLGKGLLRQLPGGGRSTAYALVWPRPGKG